MLDRPAPLSAEAVRQFDETGWTLAPGFFSAAEVAEMAAWTDELEQRPELVGEHWMYRQPSLLDPSRKANDRARGRPEDAHPPPQLRPGRPAAAARGGRGVRAGPVRRCL